MRYFAFPLILLFVIFGAQGAQATQKVALVIGNSSYGVAPLKNPVNDADDISRALQKLGFETITLKDSGGEQMEMGVQRFSSKLRGAEIGLFFFAGHGMQIDGINYLLPVDINVTGSAAVRHRSISAQWVQEEMEQAGNPTNIIILDACRNNPFPVTGRGFSPGLAQMKGSIGMIIAYATSPDSVAQDGAGRNGLYTKHLLKSLQRKDWDVREMLDNAGLGVIDESDAPPAEQEASS